MSLFVEFGIELHKGGHVAKRTSATEMVAFFICLWYNEFVYLLLSTNDSVKGVIYL